MSEEYGYEDDYSTVAEMRAQQEYEEYCWWQYVKEMLDIRESYPQNERWQKANEFLSRYAAV